MTRVPGHLIHSALVHFAQATPEHPALCFGESSYSYAELDAKSNQLAAALLGAGLERGDRVGIFLRKGLDLGLAIYGILKAGGVFVPLDPFLPTQRLAFILGDCGVRHLVSSEAMASQLGQLDGALQLTVFGLASLPGQRCLDWPSIEALPSTPVEPLLIDLDLGYLMYTSGSTGEPKGMLHTHRGSLAYARWGAQHVGLRAADRVASHAPLHFDLSIFDFFSTLQAGATVVLVPEPVTKFPASWTQLIEDQAISVVFTVPYTLMEMLLRGALEQRDLSSLRWILFGGEPFPPKHLADLMKRLPAVRFTNVYGPAEAPSCTAFDLPGPPQDLEQPIPIGTLSVNSRGLVLDEEDSECAPGEAGELCIQSTTLTQGYWGRPDLNRAAFWTRPGPGHFPEVFYRTGDVVQLHEDGQLRFLGRRDRMIKTRGHRVELDEVEAALLVQGAVDEAAAFAVSDGAGSTSIVAVVVLHLGSEASSAELLRGARERLPAYALPRAIHLASELPRTSGGKIDRKQLAKDPSLRP